MKISFCALLFPMMLITPLKTASAQPPAQTKTITLDEAESLFLANNYQLLAAKFQIDAARAQVLQARLWNNPSVNFEQNVYNPNNGRVFDVTPSGQTAVQIQQLFVLAGKRGYQVRMAEINAMNAEQSFYELLRNLRSQLQTTFYNFWSVRESIAFYDDGIARLSETVAGLERAYAKRLILQSEVMRIRALLFALQNDRAELLAQSAEQEQTLLTLLGLSADSVSRLIPAVAPAIREKASLVSVEEAVRIALEKRPEILMARNAVSFGEQHLALQQALRYPDVTLGLSWDRAGNFVQDYFGVSVTTELPVFNRNQGNIDAAEKTLKAQHRLAEKISRDVEREVRTVYTRALEKDRLYQEFRDKFTRDYTELADRIVLNYQKHYLTAMEFADFFEAYRNTFTAMLKLEAERITTFAALNSAVNAQVVRLK